MHRILKIVAYLILGLNFSCESVIDIDVPEHESRIVVNGFISNRILTQRRGLLSDFDSYMALFIGKSETILGQRSVRGSFGRTVDQPLENISASIMHTSGARYPISLLDTVVYDTFYATDFNTGDTIDTYINSYGAYGFLAIPGFAPQIGEKYMIDVSHPDHPPVQVEVAMPSPVSITGASIQENAIVDFEGFTYNRLDLQFNDPPGEENYYRVEAWLNITELGIEDTFYNRWNLYLSDLESIQNLSYEELAPFSDKEFDGTATEVQVYLDDFNFDYLEQEGIEVRVQLEVALISVSKSYYEYIKSLQRYTRIQDIEIPFFGGEPVQVFSNVEGGYGVLTAEAHGETGNFIIDIQ